MFIQISNFVRVIAAIERLSKRLGVSRILYHPCRQHIIFKQSFDATFYDLYPGTSTSTLSILWFNMYIMLLNICLNQYLNVK